MRQKIGMEGIQLGRGTLVSGKVAANFEVSSKGLPMPLGH